jgi:hypothetical protein
MAARPTSKSAALRLAMPGLAVVCFFAGAAPAASRGEMADGLGTRLPPPLSANAIAGLLLPAADQGKASLIGAKAWSGYPDGFVAIACVGGPAADPHLPQCRQPAYLDPGPPLRLFLGIIAAKPGMAPRLVARAGPIATGVDWNHTNLSAPETGADAASGLVAPQSFDRFDLAPYRIAPGETAFGLRGRWDEPSAGGLAAYSALYLFAVDGGELRQVLAVPISAFEDRAGPPGGGRDRSDARNILVISPHLSDGHFDLIVRDAAGGWRQPYRWSNPDRAYRPGGN